MITIVDDLGEIKVNRGTAFGIAMDFDEAVTGWTFMLYVKTRRTDPDASAASSVTGSITDAATGTVQFDVPAAATDLTPGTYTIKILWTDASGKSQSTQGLLYIEAA